jgi:hypothetical protein
VLDIRATHYVSPLSEVDFASVQLTVHIVNVADETGLVQGKFRVYNDNTGLLIHTSDIAPFTLTAGETFDAPALTDFDPPAPADDTYFVIFDGIASNPLVPDGIQFMLGAFYFDVKPTGMGPAPAAHGGTHENGGSDEINVNGLSGELADDQPALEHGNEKHDPDFCPLPDPLDDTLPLRADGTAAPPIGIRQNYDFLIQPTGLTVSYLEFRGLASGAGSSLSPLAGEPDHPGIWQYTSGAAVSGGCLRSYINSIRIAGNTRISICFRVPTLANTSLILGLSDGATAVVANNLIASYLTTVGVPGVLRGACNAGGAGPTYTGTSYTILAATWYRLTIEVNAAANSVLFSLYSAAGALLWSDSVAATIPTAAGQEVALHLGGTSSGSVAFLDIDYYEVWIARALAR